jgi:hypothetical protein
MSRDGFIEIHPTLRHERPCPRCQGTMPAQDWAVTGIWTSGLYYCSRCVRHYWVDLPFNLGVLSSCYLCVEDGTVVRPGGPAWYANLTLAGWKTKSARPVTIERRVLKTTRRICLVNALGNCWGDAIATIAKLNALKEAAEAQGIGIVVLTTPNLAQHLPAFIAEAWLVNGCTHADTAVWNDTLAALVKSEVARYDSCNIPALFQLPNLSPRELHALTGIEPFDRAQWDEKLTHAPTVTFMWRDDRCWARELPVAHWMNSDLAYRRGLGRLIRFGHQGRAALAPHAQARRVNSLAGILRKALPSLDFAVCGLGVKGRLAPWIKDLRSPTAAQEENQAWCERASHSHLLIGVLGSHMVLPGGHAGGVIDLLPAHHLKNVLTDLLVTTQDKRESLFLYRTFPLATTPVALAETAISMLVNYTCANLSLNGEFYQPLDEAARERLALINARRVEVVEKLLSPRSSSLLGP